MHDYETMFYFLRFEELVISAFEIKHQEFRVRFTVGASGFRTTSPSIKRFYSVLGLEYPLKLQLAISGLDIRT